MRDVARRDSSRLYVPQFLDADSVALRIDVVEFFLLDEFFCERTARAFGKDSDFRAQLVSWREVVFRLAVFVDALVFRDNAADSFSVINQFRAAKFLEDIDARRFHEGAKPLGHFAQ